MENPCEKLLCNLPSRNTYDSSDGWFAFYLGDLVSLVTDGIILFALASGKHRARLTVPFNKDFFIAARVHLLFLPSFSSHWLQYHLYLMCISTYIFHKFYLE